VTLAMKMRRIGGICFGLMWIPFAAGMMAMFSLPTGSYDWGELPLVTRLSIIVGGTLMFAATGLLVGSFVAGGIAHRQLLAKGQLATAKVLRLSETGTTVNRQPLVRLRLEVQPPSGLTFEAETERLMSLVEIPQFTPGSLVHVKFDPETRAVAILSAEDFEKSVR
jgi:hypothetical protein